MNEWLLGKVLPEFSLSEIRHEVDSSGLHTTTGTITNAGTGTIQVNVAAILPADGGDPESEEGQENKEKPRESGSIQTVTVGPGRAALWKLTTVSKPVEVVVDPDVMVLQMARKLAKAPVP